jgi:glycosyltransferase involved in cell wall biosynthesis
MNSTRPSARKQDTYSRHGHFLQGFFQDEFQTESAWIRERALVRIPPLPHLGKVVIRGEFKTHPNARGIEAAPPALEIRLNGQPVAAVAYAESDRWEASVSLPPSAAGADFTLIFTLRGVGATNFLAWLGRVTRGWPLLHPLQHFRAQNKNRQLRFSQIEIDGELAFDFSNRHATFVPAFARRHARIGLNVVGFFRADLGVGESARCMLRAAQAAEIPVSAVPLKIACKAAQNDETYAAILTGANPHPVNVFHLDAPAVRDVDRAHGKDFMAGKYNVGYWAWELPEFPDSWITYFSYFDEIWCPSDFVRDAIAAKSHLPVITQPHAIQFSRPTGPVATLRAKFGLPVDKYLFLFLYDLNSYSERKNPRAVIEAFRRAALAERGAALVIKVHGVAGNEDDLEALRSATADLPGTLLVASSLRRDEVYELEAACDCFVSLHRSEGFGFAPAECMYLGKPVIATHWSATAEYLNESNGCPVRAQLVTLDRNHGPYAKGQTWAEPDIDQAAAWMVRLFQDPALGVRLGAAGRQTMESRFSPAAIGARYRQRLDAIASW